MDSRLLRFYREHLERFGPDDARALAWRGAASQQNRFKILSEIADLSGTAVLDEGCGVGDLYPYLAERFSEVAYMGIDIIPEAIVAAREKYPAATFISADFSTYDASEGAFDYVLSSGALTFRVEGHARVYEEHMRKMYRLARKGVAFNVLDKYAIHEDAEYVGYDSEALRTFCETFAARVEVRKDYSDEDITVYLYH